MGGKRRISGSESADRTHFIRHEKAKAEKAALHEKLQREIEESTRELRAKEEELATAAKAVADAELAAEREKLAKLQ